MLIFGEEAGFVAGEGIMDGGGEGRDGAIAALG
jgi:hypothetical protein